MPVSDDLVHVEIRTRAGWRAWLAAHHRGTESIWLVYFKKSVRPELHVTYDDIVEEALCFGWVDSLVRKLDDERAKILVSPRKPKSTWSKANKQRIRRLQSRGLLTEAGCAVVERAKKDGTWSILDDVEALIEPQDLASALNASKSARKHWDGFPASAKKAMLWWLKSAKRKETRQKRLDTIVKEARAGRRAQG